MTYKAIYGVAKVGSTLVSYPYIVLLRNQIIYMIDQQGHAGNLTCIFKGEKGL
jgi:hypothetical protein